MCLISAASTGWSALSNRIPQTSTCPETDLKNIAAVNPFSVSLLSQAKYSLYDLKYADSIFLHVGGRNHACTCTC